MVEVFRLSPDGPHDDDYTCHIAAALSEAVRVLNHATRSRSGVVHPSTVHQVLGCSGAAVAGLNLTLTQIAGTLRQKLASGRLGDDHRPPDERVDSALSELAAARQTAHALADRPNRALNATADLHLRTGKQV